MVVLDDFMNLLFERWLTDFNGWVTVAWLLGAGWTGEVF